MAMLDGIRRLIHFWSLNKIKLAIHGLSEEEWMELLQWMQAQISDVETADPESSDFEDFETEGSCWY